MRGLPSLQTTVQTSGELRELATELIDAHADTVELLLTGDVDELDWCAHREYLQALQRLGHATLATHDSVPAATAQRPPLSWLRRPRRRSRQRAVATVPDELAPHPARPD
jgi:hypothetical protein